MTRMISIVLLAIAVLAAAVSLNGQTREITKKERELQKLRNEIGAYEAKLRDSEKRERSTLERLDDLEQQAVLIKQLVGKLKDEEEQLTKEIRDRISSEKSRIKLEKELNRKHRLEAIGTLAGGIAHDFNNILAAVIGYSELSLASLDKSSDEYANTKEILQAGMRAKDLIRQILTFSRRQPQEMVVQPLAPLVEESLGLLRATLPAVVSLEAALTDKRLYVRADATQIGQVLMNLCTNAWHALSGSTGVTATSESTVFTAAQAFSAACANFNYTNTADSLVINGVSITGSGSTISDAIDVINNFSNQTGVRATSSGTSIVLEAPDGRNIHLESDASLTGVNNIGILSAATVEKVTAAAVTLTSDNKFKLEDAGGGTTLASIGITSNTYSIDATTTIDTISLLSTSSAGNAIEITDNTLRQLNNLRSKIGALQNRLESTRRNLSTTYENLSAARSRILDADIAVETAEMTKMQILQQAGLAVLAQANMAPQAVLSLLQ